MSQGLIQYAVLLPILYIGVRSSIEDFRHGKIYRHHIRLGLLAGLAWYAALGLFYAGFFGDWSVFSVEIPRVLAASLVAFALAAGMWWVNVWSAGDAKLFVVFVFLSPPALTAHLSVEALSPFVLLVNAYTVAFVIITLDFLLRFGRRAAARTRAFLKADGPGRGAQLGALKDLLAANWLSLLKTLTGLMFVLLLVRLLRTLVRGQLEGLFHLDDTLLFLGLFLAFRPLHRLFQIRAAAALALAGLVVYVGYLLVLDPGGGRLREVLGIGTIALSLLVFRQVYTYWSSLVEVTRVPLESLRAHMIISPRTRRELLASGLFDAGEMEQLGVEGLSDEYARRIRTHYRDEAHPGLVEIEKTIPFAPFLFLGLLASFITHDVLVRF